MRKTEMVANAILWVGGVLGGYGALNTINNIEDTDTTATAIRKTARAGVGITVYVVTMNYFLRKDIQYALY